MPAAPPAARSGGPGAGSRELRSHGQTVARGRSRWHRCKNRGRPQPAHRRAILPGDGNRPRVTAAQTGLTGAPRSGRGRHGVGTRDLEAGRPAASQAVISVRVLTGSKRTSPAIGLCEPPLGGAPVRGGAVACPGGVARLGGGACRAGSSTQRRALHAAGLGSWCSCEGSDGAPVPWEASREPRQGCHMTCCRPSLSSPSAVARARGRPGGRAVAWTRTGRCQERCFQRQSPRGHASTPGPRAVSCSSVGGPQEARRGGNEKEPRVP